MALEHDPDHVPVPERDLDYDCFEISTLTPHIGAEIRGLDLSAPANGPARSALRST